MVKVIENNKETIILEFDNGTRCKMLKSHMKTLYNFLKGYFDFKEK